MVTNYQAMFPPCPKCGRPKDKRAKTCAFCAGKGRGSVLRRNYVSKLCGFCGSQFSIPLWRERQNRGVFCSRLCANHHLSTLTGENSLRWEGGADHRRGVGWKTGRVLALAKAGGRCQRCNREFGYHDYGVHHRKAYRLCKNDAEANSINNLIVLCRSCHAKADRLGVTREKGGDANDEHDYFQE